MAKEVTMIAMMRQQIRLVIEGAEYSKSVSENSWSVLTIVMNG